MDILRHGQRQTLLDYLTRVKASLEEWLFVDVRLTEPSDPTFSVADAAALLQENFNGKEGKIYIFNDRDILMLLRWGKERSAEHISEDVKKHLPAGSCEVHVCESSANGLLQLKISLSPQKTQETQSINALRRLRPENVILIADDDMYMRLLVKKGITTPATILELADGGEVLAAYQKQMPDVLFLDIHMPHVDGLEILRGIQAIDPESYVIMLSADSSRENVEEAIHKGAKGFMTKPFSKEKLQGFIQKCPTISQA